MFQDLPQVWSAEIWSFRLALYCIRILAGREWLEDFVLIWTLGPVALVMGCGIEKSATYPQR